MNTRPVPEAPAENAGRTLFCVTADPENSDGALSLVRDLFSALQMMKLRGRDDPRTRARVEQFHRTLGSTGNATGKCRLVRSGPYLFSGGVRVRPLADVRLAVQSLLLDLERLGAGGWEWDEGVTLDVLLRFIEHYPKMRLEAVAADWTEPIELLPGIVVLPCSTASPETSAPEAGRRTEARRVFFHALAGARHLVQHFERHHVPEMRKSRALVHEMIDNLVEEEYSLLGLSAIQNFDHYTFQHSVHVSILSMALGQGLGLPRRDLAELGVAALFHDMGKIQVPKKVLLKPGRFDTQDWSVMQTHPLAGARELLLYGGTSELAAKVMLVSTEHHMRFDGTGYPRLGQDWTQGLFARLVSVSDCFDAMTASRAYVERPFTPDSVVRYMIENAGRLFDPDLLRLFVGKVGLYPAGSLVRLESSELALVVEPPLTPHETARPRVVLLEQGPAGFLPAGERLLAGGPAVDPRFRIQAGCHPRDHGVDVDALLTRIFLEGC